LFGTFGDYRYIDIAFARNIGNSCEIDFGVDGFGVVEYIVHVDNE